MSEPTFLIKNLSRDPESRTARRLRPGNKTGFILDDGRRIRRAGGRPMEVSLKDFDSNLDRICDGVRERYIEVSDPDGRVMSAEDLASYRQYKMEGPPKEEDKKEVKTEETEVPPPIPEVTISVEVSAIKSAVTSIEIPAEEAKEPQVEVSVVAEEPKEAPSEEEAPVSLPTAPQEETKPRLVLNKRSGKK